MDGWPTWGGRGLFAWGFLACLPGARYSQPATVCLLLPATACLVGWLVAWVVGRLVVVCWSVGFLFPDATACLLSWLLLVT